MATLNTYLNFLGKTEEAFEFYSKAFGVKLTMLQRFRDVPGHEKFPVEDQNKVMHVEMPIGAHNRLMGTDAIESMGQTVTSGTQVSLSLNVDSEAEAEKIFNGLSAGATITMPLQKTFWNAYFGMLTDRYGIQWMVNYDYGDAK